MLLEKALKPVIRRLLTVMLARAGVFSLGAALSVCGIILAAAKFVYLPQAWAVCAVCAALALAAVVVYVIAARPRLKDAAVAADRLGCKERFSTALELGLSNVATPFAELVKRDALEYAAKLNPGKQIKLDIPRRAAVFCGCAFLAFCFALWFPAPAAAEIAKREELAGIVAAQEEKITGLEKELETIDAEIAEEINAKLKELMRELKSAESRKEALDATQKAQEQLERIKKEALEQSQSALNENAETGELSAEQMATQSLAEKTGEMVDLANSKLAEAGRELSGSELVTLESGKTPKSGQGQGEGEGGSDGEGQGEGEGQGNGEGEGQSKEKGQGEGEGQGSGWGSGHVEDEQIYSRPLEDRQGYDSGLTGGQSEEGLYEQQDVKNIGEAGELVPYKNVVGDYAEKALKSLSEYDIPFGMHELIRQYFSSIE